MERVTEGLEPGTDRGRGLSIPEGCSRFGPKPGSGLLIRSNNKFFFVFSFLREGGRQVSFLLVLTTLFIQSDLLEAACL